MEFYTEVVLGMFGPILSSVYKWRQWDIEKLFLQMSQKSFSPYYLDQDDMPSSLDVELMKNR